MWRRGKDEGVVAHIAECSDGDAYTLVLVLDGALGRIEIGGGGGGHKSRKGNGAPVLLLVKREGRG